jgi:LPS-assembly protein
MLAPVRPEASVRVADRARQATRLWLAALPLCLLLGAADVWAQAKLPVTVQGTEQEAVILADHIAQIGGTNELLVAEGNVEITQGTTRLLADRVEVNRDTGEAVAQGRVVFFDGQDRLVGDRVDYNLKTGTGIVYTASTFSAPFYHLSANRMDRVGPGTYRLRNGVFTTCEGDEPAWAFHIGSGTANLDDIVYGQNASFWLLDKVPLVPWVPFFAAAIRRDRQSGFLPPEYGESSKKGLFLKIPYYWVINDSQDMTISLDTYTRRGVGVDGEYRYIYSQQMKGTFDGFFIRESLRDPTDRERLGIPEDRGYYSFKHEWLITPRLSLKINSNVTTDDLVFKEYGNLLTQRSLQRADTNVFLSQRWDTWSLVANVYWYQDLTTPAPIELQRVPEIKLVGLRQVIPGLAPILYETNASFTEFYRALGSGGVRADFHERVFLPLPVAGLFTFTPYLGGRLTYYNRQAVGQEFSTQGVTVEQTIDTNRLRRQVEWGFEAESRLSRVFLLDDGSSGGTGITALQHVIEPRAVLTEIRGYDQKALPQYDQGQRGATGGVDTGFWGSGRIDNIQRLNEVTYSLTNRINAKSIPSPDAEPVRWELMRLIVSQTFDISKAINSTQPFEDVRADVIVNPNQRFRFSGYVAYNLYGLGLREAAADLTATYRDINMTVGTRFNDIIGSNYFVAQVSAKLLANLDGHAAVGYDFHDNASVENRLGFDWRFQCFAISAEYVNRKRNESEFHISINLLGIGETGTKVGK